MSRHKVFNFSIREWVILVYYFKMTISIDCYTGLLVQMWQLVFHRLDTHAIWYVPLWISISMYHCLMKNTVVWIICFHFVLINVIFFFLAFDFCRFCVVIVCFHPRHNGQLPPTAKDSNLTIQGNYWYHCYILVGMTRSMTGDWTRDLPY